MCDVCGYNPCSCSNNYSYNWFSTQGLPCTACEDTPVVCKKSVPSLCIKYNGPSLANILITKDVDTLNDVLGKLDTIKHVNDLKFTAILTVLNDINTRLNTLAGGTPHIPYTIL